MQNCICTYTHSPTRRCIHMGRCATHSLTIEAVLLKKEKWVCADSHLTNNTIKTPTQLHGVPPQQREHRRATETPTRPKKGTSTLQQLQQQRSTMPDSWSAHCQQISNLQHVTASAACKRHATRPRIAC